MSSGSAPPRSPTTAAESGAGFESLFRVFAGLRSDAESRFRRQLDKISNAEKILANLVTSVDRSTIEVVVTVGRKKSRPRKPVSDLAVVECAVTSFGEDSFILDDLIARVRAPHRRTYHLIAGPSEAASPNATDSSLRFGEPQRT